MLVRDYGLYDHAMLRFTPGHKLADSFYVRQDGTRAYYFSTGKSNWCSLQNVLSEYISSFSCIVNIYHPHREGGIVFSSVCVSLCLFVCLLRS